MGDTEHEVSAVGGARIGWTNATWPFAQLVVTKHELNLSCLGQYEFSHEQIAGLEAHGSIPFLGRGVRIIHTRADYPAEMIFWCLGSPEALIARIRDVGFVAKGSRTAVPRREGMPFRWAAIIVIFLVWNALFLLDNMGETNSRRELGWSAVLAIGLLCATAWTLPQSPGLQSLILKPGRSIDEIKSFVGLIRLVSTLMLVLVTTFALTRGGG